MTKLRNIYTGHIASDLGVSSESSKSRRSHTQPSRKVHEITKRPRKKSKRNVSAPAISSILQASPSQIAAVSGVTLSRPIESMPTIEKRYYPRRHHKDSNKIKNVMFVEKAPFHPEMKLTETPTKVIQAMPGQPVKLISEPVFLGRDRNFSDESDDEEACPGYRQTYVGNSLPPAVCCRAYPPPAPPPYTPNALPYCLPMPPPPQQYPVIPPYIPLGSTIRNYDGTEYLPSYREPQPIIHHGGSGGARPIYHDDRSQLSAPQKTVTSQLNTAYHPNLGAVNSRRDVGTHPTDPNRGAGSHFADAHRDVGPPLGPPHLSGALSSSRLSGSPHDFQDALRTRLRNATSLGVI